MKKLLVGGITILTLLQPLAAETLRGVIHLHSVYSGKKLTLEQLVTRCRERNINVVFFTDDALRRWEYGLFPLRNILSYRHEEDSVLRLGPERYLAEIGALRSKYPDMVLIPGVELSPFYYWSGNPVKERKLTLHNWQRHLLVIGLENPGDYETLPLTSNTSALQHAPFKPFLLWPLLLLFPLKALWAKRKRKTTVFLSVIAGAALFNNYPFREAVYDPYHEDRGAAPYQRLIDDVIAKKGLVFWAHPDSPDFKDGYRRGPVTARTLPYGDMLLSTERYTGFAGFYEGYKQSAAPGGYWDQALVSYCEGKRASPPWVIGEADYIDEPDIDEVQMIIEAAERTPHGVLDALAQGTFYVLYRPVSHSLVLTQWELRPDRNGLPLVRFKIESSDGKPHTLQVRLVRNGKLYKLFEGTTPFEADYSDSPPAGHHYYRLDIYERYGSQILTNPLFFKNNLIE